MTQRHVGTLAHASSIGDGAFVLSVFSGKAVAADVAELRTVINHVHQRVSRPLSLLTVVEQDSYIARAGRDEIAAVLADGNSMVSHWAIVIEGTGLWAASARAITTGVFIRARPVYALKVVGRVEDASRWLQQNKAEPPPFTWQRDLAALRAYVRTKRRPSVA